MIIDHTDTFGADETPEAAAFALAEHFGQSNTVTLDDLVRSILDASLDAMALVQVPSEGGAPIVLAQNGAMADLRYRTRFEWEVGQLLEKKQAVERVAIAEVRITFTQMCEDNSGALLTLTC